jgi:hypothetical protein
MSTRAVSCPNCQKEIQVPAEAAGKKIKCKACQHVFPVPAADAPTPAARAKPAAAKPAQAKPAQAKPASPPPPPAANAPIPFKDDDEDEDVVGAKPKAYDVTADPDEDIPRCPFCAVDLDPPDTKICLNCGYDLTARKRHRTVKTYALTGGDIFKWWLPAIIWGVVMLFCGSNVLYYFIVLPQTEESWRKDGFLVQEKENPLTKKKEFLVEPAMCGVCFALIVIVMGVWGVPVIVRRIRQPKPTEQEKHK